MLWLVAGGALLVGAGLRAANAATATAAAVSSRFPESPLSLGTSTAATSPSHHYHSGGSSSSSSTLSKLMIQSVSSESSSSSSSSSPLLLRGGGTNDALRSGGFPNVIQLVLQLLSNLAQSIGQSKRKSWISLILAICMENVAVTLTKWARDTSSPSKMVLAIGVYIMSVLGFAASLAKIDVSVAYAVWAAMGTSIVSLAGMTLFGERCDPMKILCLSLVILGVVGLNLQDGHSKH